MSVAEVATLLDVAAGQCETVLGRTREVLRAADGFDARQLVARLEWINLNGST